MIITNLGVNWLESYSNNVQSDDLAEPTSDSKLIIEKRHLWKKGKLDITKRNLWKSFAKSNLNFCYIIN